MLNVNLRLNDLLPFNINITAFMTHVQCLANVN